VKCSLIDEYKKKPSAHGMSTFNESSVKGVPWETCYYIEYSQSLKARRFFSSGNLNGTCQENEVLNP
jgi:hypothetical protein